MRLRGEVIDGFEFAFRPWRFNALPGLSVSDEVMSYFGRPPLSLENRYRLTMLDAMLHRPGCVLYRCPRCHHLTPVHFTKSDPGWRKMGNGPWRRNRPWEVGSGTVCLWCRATISRGWFTGRRFIRHGDTSPPVSAEVMREVLGESP